MTEAARFAGKVFRPQFFAAITGVYFRALVRHARSTRQLDTADLAAELGHNRSTGSRWDTNTHPAGGDKFFAALSLVLRTNLGDITWPDRRDVLFEAVQCQLVALREQFCEPPHPPEPPDRRLFRALRFAMGCAAVGKLIPEQRVTKAVREMSLLTTVNEVNAQFEQAHAATSQPADGRGTLPPPQLVLATELHDWLVAWGMPYTLLAMGTKNVTWELDDGQAE